VEIEEKLKKIVLEILDVPESELDFDSPLREGLGVTSVDVVEILADIENQFDIEVPEEDAEKFRTMNDIVAYLKEKTEG